MDGKKVAALEVKEGLGRLGWVKVSGLPEGVVLTIFKKYKIERSVLVTNLFKVRTISRISTVVEAPLGGFHYPRSPEGFILAEACPS